MNVESTVIYLILSSTDREDALENFGKLKSEYFKGSPMYSAFNELKKFYSEHNNIPNFEEILLQCSARGSVHLDTFSTLRLLKTPDIDLPYAVGILQDSYIQREALNEVNLFLDRVRDLPSQDIVLEIAEMSLRLDEKLDNDEVVCTPKSLRAFEDEEDLEASRMFTGISNLWDSKGGIYRERLYFIGGKRGSGKSIIGANITVAGAKAGLVCPFFTIEMNKKETYDRMIAMLAEVSFQEHENNKLSRADVLKVCNVRAELFEGGEALLEEHLAKPDFDKVAFEDALVTLPEREDIGKIVVIDHRELTLASIDVQLAKLRAKYGDRLGPVVVDYVNQIIHESSRPDDVYDWKTQTHLAKALKNMARKYEVPIISPYQTDASGEARMAKGLLDAVDGAWVIEKHDTEDDDTMVVNLVCQKLRGGIEFDMAMELSKRTLLIDPAEVDIPDEKEEGGNTSGVSYDDEHEELI